MSAEIEKEKAVIIGEWERRALDDLVSAEIILKESDKYEISVYHSHQAVEKFLKANLLKLGQTFKFTHDIDVLFEQVFGDDKDKAAAEKIAHLNALYPSLRYPFGEKITKDQAINCLAIAKEAISRLRK
ncbi:HEPN domain-containing protein [Candidatus Saganbacteria bacterium]|nr:HEPN domain-containing protein [Candidatus Saganbacteria bacterium]